MARRRDKFGEVALRQLLRETHEVNPTFYGLLMKQLKEEGLLDKVRGDVGCLGRRCWASPGAGCGNE